MDRDIMFLMDRKIWDYFIQSLTDNYADNTHGFWSDGTDILCKTEEEARGVANFLEDMGFTSISTGYYDPDEDERNGCVDEKTGCWFISNI